MVLTCFKNVRKIDHLAAPHGVLLLDRKAQFLALALRLQSPKLNF